jgi:hypothetical protein
VGRYRGDDYGVRLRRMVANSADCLPAETTAYLQHLAKHGHWEAKAQFLKDCRRLVDHIPGPYVDFVIQVLSPKPEQRYEDDSFEYHRQDQEILQHQLEFFPPAHVQGPFLYLLRKKEDEGLRLVHTLTNLAVAGWRYRFENPYLDQTRGGAAVKLLPILIDLPSGRREFWGDGQVYYWYRPNGNGPHAVTSALMALEVWIEEQLEGGRNPEELFNKILSASDCVALLGLCVSVALAYPTKCLRAALPIVASPAVWLMEMSRAVADRTPSLSFDPSGRYELIYKLRAERDKRPQRSVDIRNLSVFYLGSGDPTLRASFKAALAQFTERLPLLSEQDRQDPAVESDLRERLENFQAWGDEANFRRVPTPDGDYITFEPPEHLKLRNEGKLKPVLETQRWVRLDIWARRSIEAGRVVDGMTVEEAVQEAKDLGRPDDFALPYELGQNLEGVRPRAIAGVAGVLIATSFHWANEHDLVPWARGILLAAARSPIEPRAWLDRHTWDSSHPKIAAALGLASLVSQGTADSDVKNEVLGLVADPQVEVQGAAFQGLYGGWGAEPILCWNALSLALSDCTWPRESYNAINRFEEKARADEMLKLHRNNVAKGILPDLPRICPDRDAVFLWDSAWRALHALPLAHIAADSEGRSRLLQLADDLIAWTVERNLPDPDDPHGYSPDSPYEWNYSFLDWLSLLARSLTPEEVEKHIFSPIRETWPRASILTADLLAGWIRHQIGYETDLSPEAKAGWREICKWALEDLALAYAVKNGWLESQMGDAVALMVYVRRGMSLVPEAWPHAPVFIDVTEKWIDTVGTLAYAYSCLITMLEGPGWSFVPEPALSWLSRIVGASPDLPSLWNKDDNGKRTAELLQRMYNEHQAQLRQNPTALERCSRLIDRLVAAGISLAGVLQQALERPVT